MTFDKEWKLAKHLLAFPDDFIIRSSLEHIKGTGEEEYKSGVIQKLEWKDGDWLEIAIQVD